MSFTPYPRCEAHRQAIRDSLPGDCPLRERAAYKALVKIQDDGFAAIDSQDHAKIQHGLWLVNRGQNVCYHCIGALAKHPTVVAIREQLQEASLVTITSESEKQGVETLPPPITPTRPDWMPTQKTRRTRVEAPVIGGTDAQA